MKQYLRQVRYQQLGACSANELKFESSYFPNFNFDNTIFDNLKMDTNLDSWYHVKILNGRTIKDLKSDVDIQTSKLILDRYMFEITSQQFINGYAVIASDYLGKSRYYEKEFLNRPLLFCYYQSIENIIKSLFIGYTILERLDDNRLTDFKDFYENLKTHNLKSIWGVLKCVLLNDDNVSVLYKNIEIYDSNDIFCEDEYGNTVPKKSLYNMTSESELKEFIEKLDSFINKFITTISVNGMDMRYGFDILSKKMLSDDDKLLTDFRDVFYFNNQFENDYSSLFHLFQWFYNQLDILRLINVNILDYKLFKKNKNI